MLPLTLLKAAQGNYILVELKTGETYNGKLLSCDSWMNLNLGKVICTSREGDKFWKMETIYIRGYSIKYLSVPQNVYETCPDEPAPENKKLRGSERAAGNKQKGRRNNAPNVDGNKSTRGRGSGSHKNEFDGSKNRGKSRGPHKHVTKS